MSELAALEARLKRAPLRVIIGHPRNPVGYEQFIGFISELERILPDEKLEWLSGGGRRGSV